MKHLKTYKIFESNFGPGEFGNVLYKIPGTDERLVIPIKIDSNVPNSNMVYVISLEDVGTVPKGKKFAVKASKIMPDENKKAENPITPLNPSYLNQQPVPTDYNKPGNLGGGGVSNDVVLPNS